MAVAAPRAKKPTPLPTCAKVLETIVGKSYERHSKVFWSFVKFAACALSLQQREDEYLAEAKHYTPEVMQLFSEAFAALVVEMERHPFTDVLGPIYMDWGSKGDQAHGGEFFTPQCLCDMMGAMVCGDGSHLPATGPITLSEPACGAGGMVLGFAKAMVAAGISPRRLRATCVDVNRACCDMTFVNLTLWGIAAEVIHGNTLSLECWSGWRNIHWLGCGVFDTYATILATIDAAEAVECGDEPGAPEMSARPPITMAPAAADLALRAVAASRQPQESLFDTDDDDDGIDFPPLYQ